MDSEKFCLRWNDFKTNISQAFNDLREEKDFFDVTLSCGEDQIQAHKVILSACSPFFRNILRRNPHQHPLLYLKDVKFKELQCVINFMYLGEVSVAQDELNSFLNVAEDLRIKGLTQGNNERIPQNEKSQNRLNESNTHDRPAKTLKNSSYVRPVPRQQQYLDNKGVHEEVAVVKTEPREPTSQFLAQATARYKNTSETVTYTEQDTVDDQYEEAGGTVALEDGYIEEGYEYQYEETGGSFAYTQDQQYEADLDALILSKMVRNDNGDWQCNDCFRTSNKKINIMEHIEASHVDSPGYNCDICYKVFKTKHSLRTHKNVKHKGVKQY